MAKYRSKTNYASIYNSDRGGINLGIDGDIYLKEETTPRQFNAPSVGTQGSSIGGAGASTNISLGTDNKFNIEVDDGAVVLVTIDETGKNTGDLIAAELELKINAALLAAGQDARVWAIFNTDHYEVYSQNAGTTSKVVITDAGVDNVADDLNLGAANGGTEAAGVDDEDFLLYTSGGMTFSQDIESNSHRSGRFHTGIVKTKKMAEFSFSTYVNMSGLAGDSIDKPVRLLWKQLLGSETVVPGTAIQYRQGLPNSYMTMVRVSTIFGEYYVGGYVRDMTLTLPGDGPATCEWSGKAATRTIAGLGKINGVVAASANVILQVGETDRYSVGAPVMVVAADGRTITHGVAGDLTIDAITALSHQLTLSGAIDGEDGGFIVPWNPGAVSKTGRDAIFTDLEGSLKLRSTSQAICATNIQYTFTNEHYDFDNCFGADSNRGFAAANRLTIAYAVTVDLSNHNFAEIVQADKFEGFDPQTVLGSVTGRYMQIDAPKWIPAVPAIEVPENGVTSVTLEGNLYQSSPGAQDPILVQFK